MKRLLFITTLCVLTGLSVCAANPNLYLNDSDIAFSDQYPDLNEVITISATVHNSGDSYSDPIFEEYAPGTISAWTTWNSEWAAQSFYLDEDKNLKAVSVYVQDYDELEPLTVSLQTSEHFVSSCAPSGIPVVQASSATVSSGDNDLKWLMVDFSTRVHLTANTTYWIVAENHATQAAPWPGAGWEGYYWLIKATSTVPLVDYSPGIMSWSADQGASWTHRPHRDLLFRLHTSTITEVAFYSGDPDSGGTLIGNDILEQAVPDSSFRVAASTWQATPAGYNDIYIRINGDNYFVESSTADNTYSKTIAVDSPRILSATTVDDDLDGKIDAYRIVFNEAVDDDTAWNESGFDVDLRSLDAFVSTGLPHHPDTADNDIIYLPFDEAATDSDSVPEVTYSTSTGDLEDFDNAVALLSAGTGDISETDGAPPVIYSASASDSSGSGPGIQAGDSVILTFSEQVSGPPGITNNNIDTVLKSTFSWTWLDGNGFIGSAVWSGANTILTITLSNGAGIPTILPGYTIETDSFTFTDAALNCSSYTFTLTGSFGTDTSSPTIVSRKTQDLDKDGYIDAVQIVFNENIDDSTVAVSSFNVTGSVDVGGEAFSSNTAGDSTDNSMIYITFNDGVLLSC